MFTVIRSRIPLASITEAMCFMIFLQCNDNLCKDAIVVRDREIILSDLPQTIMYEQFNKFQLIWPEC